MAFEESFGGQVDPGRPYFYKHDSRRQIDTSLIIVPVELEDRDAMNLKYGVRKRSKVSREMEWKIPDSNTSEANKFLAARVWKDTVNGWIRLSTQEAVDLYMVELDGTKDGEVLELGGEVLMDGRWTETLKMDLLNLKMANWIVTKATDAEAESDISYTEERAKNLQAGSTSDSESIPPLRNVSASGAN